VAASPVARLQQDEIRQAAFHPDLLGKDRLTSVRRAVLLYSSQEIQNQTAGSTLEAYYHLAEAEGKADLLAQGISELSNAQRETESMVKRGLKPPVALDVWSRQLLTAKSDSIQAQTTIDKLNSQIRTLTGLRQDGENWRIWNPEQYQVSETPIDVDAAVATGLASRPELQLLRLLVSEAGAGSASVIDDLLRSINPLLAMHAHPCLAVLLKPFALLNCPGSKPEIRRTQLSQYLSDREAAVAEEIRQAATDLQNRTQLVALAYARERSWADKIAEVRARQGQGLASFAEAASTNMDWFKARADLVQEVMAWHIAWVKLRQAQGLLPADCQVAGYCR
jgi:outer membrane protein TolC